MNDSRRNPDAKPHAEAAAAASAEIPLRFQGIVESRTHEDLVAQDWLDRRKVSSGAQRPRDWNATSRQVWLVSRLAAIFIFFAIVVGWPLGDYLAYLKTANLAEGWSPLSAFPAGALMLAAIMPVLVLLCGYFLSHTMTMMNAAESIASAARQFIVPDENAAENVEIIGSAVREQMDALNQGLEHSLMQLASVESMIRQHVEAIEVAGAAIESRATGAVERVAGERSRLMELTESLNAQADSFAAAIAEKAQASIEAIQSADALSERAEADFDDRLAHLEAAAQKALQSFDALKNALQGAGENVRATTGAIEASANQSRDSSEQALKAAARATDEAKQASRIAIETAAREAGRVAEAALEATARETAKISDAAGKASKAAQKASADIETASAVTQKSAAEAISQAAEANSRVAQRGAALAKAREALEKENARLESLIDEQRQRADKLAGAIAAQTGRLSELADAERPQDDTPPPGRADRKEAPKKSEDSAKQNADAGSRKTPAENASRPSETRPLKLTPAEQAKNPAAQAKKEDVLNLSEDNRTNAETGPARRKGADANQKEISRLEVLAPDIAERRNGSRPRRDPPVTASKAGTDPNAASRDKQKISWREILDAAEDAEPLDLSAASRSGQAKPSTENDAANAIRIIGRLQSFTLDLEVRLYGDPPPALRERFDTGDRNVFANRLLRLNEVDVKRRIRTESARDKGFEGNIHEFLQGFEKLLEDATTSETADEDLEEYLSSPLGRVYLLIGATVGYFA